MNINNNKYRRLYQKFINGSIVRSARTSVCLLQFPDAEFDEMSRCDTGRRAALLLINNA